MNSRNVALVTGANQGIGFQIAKELAAEGFTVLVASRILQNGQRAADAIGSNAHAILLDVTDKQTIEAAASRIHEEFGRLDVLVNNAAISHTGASGTPLAEIGEKTRLSIVKPGDIRAMFETNVFGVIAVTQAMLPLLRQAAVGRIVNVSSGAGSLTRHADPSNPGRAMFGAYSTSKTALNAITLAFAIDLEATNIKVNAVCPGFTSTHLNNFEGTQSLEDAARQPVRLALLGPDGPSGTFSSFGGPMPW